jgi:hypothetical protein
MIAPCPQVIVAPCIALRLLASVVHLTVEFDHQLGRRAVEIGNIGIDRVLLAKGNTLGRPSQAFPQHALGRGHFAAEFACRIYRRAA